MDCQLKHDVNPFVVARFLTTRVFLRKTEKFQKHKLLSRMYTCNYYYNLCTSQRLITVKLIIMNVLT